MQVKRVGAEQIRKLRHLVLRKGFSFSSTKYKKDNEKETFHLAVFLEKKIICCATFYPENLESENTKKGYRLRGMATDEGFRRRGAGKHLMIKAYEELKKLDCDIIWCNARIVALEFYKSLGFETKGEIFDIKGIGPHYVMLKKLV